MANVAEVEFEATVPFCWASDLDANELAMFTGLGLSPSYGLRIRSWSFAGFVPNEDGGKTAMYRMRVDGREAIWLSTLRAWCEAIERVGGEVHLCTHTDLEWDPENVETTVLARQVV